MIINHKYKFIYLKTKKTAGTSMEIALSKFCDDHDLITPITHEDEIIRQDLGYPGPRNYLLPLKKYSLFDVKHMIRRRQRQRFKNHWSAQKIRDHIEPKIWNDYFKFCFERNSYDKAISRYYWNARVPGFDMSLSDFLSNARSDKISNWYIYTLNNELAVDFVGRYENLGEDLKHVRDLLGLPSEIVLPRAKSRFRRNREHYSKVLSSDDRARIEHVCAKEIMYFGYHWEDAI